MVDSFIVYWAMAFAGFVVGGFVGMSMGIPHGASKWKKLLEEEIIKNNKIMSSYRLPDFPTRLQPHYSDDKGRRNEEK